MLPGGRLQRSKRLDGARVIDCRLRGSRTGRTIAASVATVRAAGRPTDRWRRWWGVGGRERKGRRCRRGTADRRWARREKDDRGRHLIGRRPVLGTTPPSRRRRVLRARVSPACRLAAGRGRKGFRRWRTDEGYGRRAFNNLLVSSPSAGRALFGLFISAFPRTM